VLGEHRLLCGDATVPADIERVLEGQLADMTFTDPPYNVDSANSPKDRLRGKHRPIPNDDLGSGFEAFLLDACSSLLRLHVVIGAPRLAASSHPGGGKWSTSSSGRNTRSRSAVPSIKDNSNRSSTPGLRGMIDTGVGLGIRGDVWFFDKPARNDRHPTMKPVALVERAIRNSSKSREPQPQVTYQLFRV